MGLLTNPQTRDKISKIVSRYHNKLSILCYVAGLAYFLALANRQLNAGVYFSENALLPGLVEADFYNDYGAAGHLKSLKEEVKSLKEKEREKSYRIPTGWIETRFRELGLDVYVQNFSFVYPEKLLKGQVFSGQNVYGILRAPRAASSESFVISAPYRPPESPQEKTYAGIALMLGLAKAFRRHTYWAKDIIFLVTEHEHIGMQAWLDAYHYTPNEFILAGELPGQSGPIQAAVNLEIATDTISRLNLKLEGLNGQLPNLDLINTIVRLCRREGSPAILQRRIDPTSPNTPEGYKHSLVTMLHMMWNQASGVPTGNHGLFHRYHIEAVTMQGVKMKNSRKSMGFIEIGRVVEGVSRSLNNLLERFHQSFFFYLLPATDRYVSIGLYMPPFGIMAAPIIIKAVALWISYGIHTAEKSDKNKEKSEEKSKDDADKEETKKQKDKKDDSKKQTKEDSKKPKEDSKKPKEDSKKPKVDSKKSKEDQQKDDTKKSKEDLVKQKEDDVPVGESFNTVLTLMPTCVMAVFFGLGAFYSPRYFIETADALRTKSQDGLLFGFLAIQLAAMLHPSILRSKANKKGQEGPNWQLLKCIALLSLAVLLGAIAVINISLAFLLTATWVPIVLIVRPVHSRLARLPQYLLMLIISPLGLLYLCCVAHHAFFDPVTDLTDLPMAAFETCQNALLVAVIDTHFYSSWSFSFVTLALFPAWCLFWSLLWTDPY